MPALSVTPGRFSSCSFNGPHPPPRTRPGGGADQMPVLGSPTPPPQWYPPHHSTEGKGGTTPTRPTPGPHHRGRWGGTIGGGGGGDGRTGIIYTLLGSGLQLKSPMLLGLVPGCYPESFRECSGLLGSRASAARMASTSSGNTPPPRAPRVV